MESFLYPKPGSTTWYTRLDKMALDIIRQMECLRWQAPEVSAELISLVPDSEFGMLHALERIGLIRLDFGRTQGVVKSTHYGQLYDPAGLRIISIPHQSLILTVDVDGPKLFSYLGNNWGRDRIAFMRDSDWLTAATSPVTPFAVYVGCDNPDPDAERCRENTLLLPEYLVRVQMPEGATEEMVPRRLNTHLVLGRFEQQMNELLLQWLKAQPTPPAR